MIKKIKYNIVLYFKDSEKKLIIELKSIIVDSEKQKINDYNEGRKMFEYIQKCRKIFYEVKYIENIKDFLLFNIIYDINIRGNEANKFENAKNEITKNEELIKSNDINLP